MTRASVPDIFNLHLEMINKSQSIKYMAHDDLWRKCKFSSAAKLKLLAAQVMKDLKY